MNHSSSIVFGLVSLVCCLQSVIFCLESFVCCLWSANGPSTTVEDSLQIGLFMQNKPNFPKSQMNVNPYNTTAYENIANWTLGENKPNSNPNKPNLQKAKMNVNLYVIEDYRKNDDFVVRINKANSNPISERPKMSANIYVIEDYENETTFRPQKNKPKTNPILSAVGGLQMNVKSLAKKAGQTLYRLSHIFGLQIGLIVAKYSEICNHRFVSDNKAMHVLSSNCPLPLML